MEFKKQVEQQNGILKFTISGYLDENTDLGSNYPFAEFKTVIFDCRELEYINSSGILRWIRWFEGAQNANGELEFNFLNCAKVMVDCMYTIGHFLPRRSIVLSILAPFYCEPCGHTEIEELRYLVHFDWDHSIDQATYDIPQVICSRCQKVAPPDFVPEQWFKFLKRLNTIK